MGRAKGPRKKNTRTGRCRECRKNFTYISSGMRWICDKCQLVRKYKDTKAFQERQKYIGIKECLACLQPIKGPFIKIEFGATCKGIDQPYAKICEQCWWFLFDRLSHWIKGGRINGPDRDTNFITAMETGEWPEEDHRQDKGQDKQDTSKGQTD